MSPRCYRTQRYTIKKNNIKRTLYFFVFWSIFAPMKILYTIVGTTSLILGIIGIFLPLLPTTPFLLLTAAMYFRSSPRWYHWLIQQKYLGSYIRNFREHKAIPLHAKIISVSLIWITLSYCAIWTLPYIWARILFLIIAIGTTWHILSYKTLKHHIRTAREKQLIKTLKKFFKRQTINLGRNIFVFASNPLYLCTILV